MKSIEILHPGIYTNIQDSGRKGYAFYAIPRSGVMDYQAYNTIKSLLQFSAQFSVIECTLQAPTIRFHGEFEVVVSGADMQWKLNGNPISTEAILNVQVGDVLKGSFAKSGFRGYIGFADEMIIQSHYGSASSYSYASLGGNQGQSLTKGQSIEFKKRTLPQSKVVSQSTKPISRKIQIHKGPEYHWLEESSVLSDHTFTITPQSNRMGARLQGPCLLSPLQMSQSVPVLPGFIQLLPSGQLIVLLQDGQTTGGYPRVAYLTNTELSGFNQIPIGKEVKFEVID